MINIILYFLMCLKPKIENMDNPICIRCKNYIEYFKDNKCLDLGKCKFFGEKNLVTGEYRYEFAEVCRQSEYKCGIKGKYFQSRYNSSNNISEKNE